jgi:hypothetical protein
MHEKAGGNFTYILLVTQVIATTAVADVYNDVQ